MNITFIGLGVMGSRMAINLCKNGVNLTIYNRNKSKASELINCGAKYCDNYLDAVKTADIVFTMLSNPEVVNNVAWGENGFAKAMKENSIWVDCSTVNPSFTMDMAEKSKDKGIRFVDAPVSGSKSPAEKGELIFLVGAEKKDLDEIYSLLQYMGKQIIHVGRVGLGSSMKIIINMMLAQSILAFTESMILGEKLGIPKEMLLNVLPDLPVSAPVLKGKREKLRNDDYEVEFALELLHKDLHLASICGYETNTSLTMTNTAKEIFADAKKRGFGNLDTSAVYKYYKS